MEHSRRFASILALSLLVHGAALYSLSGGRYVAPTLGESAAPAIDVTIVMPAFVDHAEAAGASAASAAPERRSPVARSDRTETPPVRRPSSRRVDTASPTVPEPVVATSGASQDRPAPADDRTQELRISQAVRQHLQAHFEYPLLARRRNWQGDVLLALHIERDGRLSRVVLDTSSGYPTLDRSALESAGRIGRIPEAGQWLGDAGYDLILPVRYRLTDG